MRIKTSELTGAALDWAAAKASDDPVTPVIVDGAPQVWFNEDITYGRPTLNGKGEPRFLLGNGTAVALFGCPYTIESADLGWIIEEERIAVQPMHEIWFAGVKSNPVRGVSSWSCAGPTARVAVYRCFVASKLGDEVDVPEELL